MNGKVSKELYIVASVLVFGVLFILLLRSYTQRNRLVYACPVHFMAQCSDVEAEYEKTCNDKGKCIYYYTKIIFANKSTVEFDFCEDVSTSMMTCYTKYGKDPWTIEYKGRSITRK